MFSCLNCVSLTVRPVYWIFPIGLAKLLIGIYFAFGLILVPSFKSLVVFFAVIAFDSSLPLFDISFIVFCFHNVLGCTRTHFSDLEIWSFARDFKVVFHLGGDEICVIWSELSIGISFVFSSPVSFVWFIESETELSENLLGLGLSSMKSSSFSNHPHHHSYSF